MQQEMAELAVVPARGLEDKHSFSQINSANIPTEFFFTSQMPN